VERDGNIRSNRGEDCIEGAGGVLTGVIDKSSICTDKRPALVKARVGTNWGHKHAKESLANV